ncbi:sensor histidine kinase [Ancylomarina euxinus]|uniref:histidine kinase n=1 Tax=Ancylomarina euxinus TaxID=2283627 RepID=A0A425Y8F4_9BACT|nr:sensor histidine kinase [Ancylomarina euxinus]MCZ4693359.1 sensor histidine kinase [Ancylomarina euxinus]MUP13587.1 hypothetical protein [Ancylomarina euxinus]RRG24766.1 sensor histidine kinase [Ancylomarina euxinus]
MRQRTKIPNKKKVFNRIKKTNRSIIIRTLIVFLPIFVLIFSASLLILITQENLEMKVYKSTEESIVNTKLENIENEINHVIDDLLILSLNVGEEQIWDKSRNSDVVEVLTKELLNVVVYHRIYDQVRLIDEDGMEVIRVNFNNGYPMVVPLQDLQNKRDRYYFTKTFSLSKNEVFVSPIDLNIENGEIEQPIKPMIRFGTPIFDRLGKKRGILLFNYFGQTILDQIQIHSNPAIDSQMMLLNSDGFWLKGSTPAEEWGFMYEDKIDLTFSNQYAEAWTRIKNEEAAQFETKKGLYTFKRLYPFLEGQKSSMGSGKAILSGESESKTKYNWIIVSYISSEVLYAKRNERRRYLSIILLFLSTSLLIISWRLSKAQYYRSIALQSLKISNETKDKFFSIISHDLKSPFNSLLGFTDMLVENYDTFDDEERKSIIETLNTSSKNTYQLLENLLTWSRSQRGIIVLVQEEIQIKSFISEIILLCQTAASNKNIQLIENVEDSLIVLADKNMLHTVLQNLISNGVKFTENKGSLIVSAKKSEKEGFIEISVSDTGVGIPKDLIADLFMMNKNVSRLGTEKEKGTGLGLILCKEFVEKQGGEIWIESEVGKGSQFIFNLPAALK